jgi:hypothetical protein
MATGVLTLLLMSAGWGEHPILTNQSRVLAAPDRVIVRFTSEDSRKACESSGFTSYEGDVFMRVIVEGAGTTGQLLIDQLLIEWEENP